MTGQGQAASSRLHGPRWRAAPHPLRRSAPRRQLPSPAVPCRLAYLVGRKTQHAGLLPPALTQHFLVHVALLGAGHQRRARRKMRIASRIAEAALVHRRLDLRTARRKRLDHRPRHAGNLEAAVGVGLLDAIAQLFQPPRQLAPVHHAGEHLALVQQLVGHGAPLAVVALNHVGGNHGVGVELGVEIARGVVAEGGGHHLLAAHMGQASGLRVLHAGRPLAPCRRRRAWPYRSCGRTSPPA